MSWINRGGVETDGSPLYIARAPVSYRGKDIGIVNGKVSEGKAGEYSEAFCTLGRTVLTTFNDIQHKSRSVIYSILPMNTKFSHTLSLPRLPRLLLSSLRPPLRPRVRYETNMTDM